MSKKKTHEEFLSEIINKPFTALELYKGTSIPIKFKCKECFNIWSAKPNNILSNSSGCPECSKRKSSRKRIGVNDWALHGQGHVVVDISTPKFPNTIMKIDFDDWQFFIDDNDTGRIRAVMYGGQKRLYAEFTYLGKNYTVHRHVMGYPELVDHKNRDGLDNRKINLRPCTNSQNCMNKLRTNKSSGRVGVDKTKWGWRARIKKDRNEVHLGYFKTKKDAICARVEAERLYFGEFA